MTIKEQFESLIRVLNLQKDRLVLCNLDTEYVDRALELAQDLESKFGDFVEVPFYDSLEDLAKSLEIESQTKKNKE